MTYSVSRHAALTSLALAIAAPSAFAQTSAEQAIDPIIITATRTPQLASAILSDTVVISADEIAHSGAGSIIDLLQRQRGIEVSTNGGAGTTSSVFIRGANSNQNVVLVDGVRIGSSTTGAANWSALPLSAIDHIEIVYGPLSTLYGAGAIGGVIQIFTKQGAGAPRVSASAGVGSYHLRSYDASIIGATDGDHAVRYALNVGKEKSDGFSAIKPGKDYYNPDKDGYNKESAAGQVSLQLLKDQEIGLVFLQTRLNAQYDDYRPTIADPRSIEKLENIAVFLKNQILPTWASVVQLAQAQDKHSDTDGPLNTKQTDVTWQNDVKVGTDTLQILLDHRKEEVTTSTLELNRARTTNSVAASYNLKRDAQLASISLRNDDSSQYGSKTTGALGYGYRFNSALRASVSYGTSFLAPSFNDLYYPEYGVASNKPEKGRNFETGIYFNDGTSQLSASYYHNRVTDLLVNTDTCPVQVASHPYGCAYNVNQATLEGLTLAASRQIGALNLKGNVDFQDPRDETTGLQLARRAKQHAKLAVEYGVDALKGGVELQLSAQRFEGSGNTTKLGGYGLLNLYATYQLAPDWSMLVRWNNATDKQYELASTYATPRSNLFAALRYSMK